MRIRHLSISGVKAMLTRRGVDHSHLEFQRIDRSTIHTAGEYNGQFVEVIDIRITGDRQARNHARQALGDAGLELSPMPEYDDWTRGSYPVSA